MNLAATLYSRPSGTLLGALGLERWEGIVAEGLETVEPVRAVCFAGHRLGQSCCFSRLEPDYVAGMLLVEERGKREPMRAVG